MVKEPIVGKLANGIYLNWSDIKVTATATKVKRLSDERITCQFYIETTRPAMSPTLYFGDYSVLSLSHRRDLERLLKSQDGNIDWLALLNQASYRIAKSYQRGEPVQTVRSTDEVPPLQFLLSPYLPLGHPTVFYGDGGCGKSYLAVYLAIVARLPWPTNPCGIKVAKPDEPMAVVYLDYETTKDDFTRRVGKIVDGAGLDLVDIEYRRCYEPLADEIDDLVDTVGKVDLVIIDSIGAACAGDLHGSDTPTRYFNAMRKFNTTTLSLFHQNKSGELYGNRFFWNYARMVWEIKKVQSPGEPCLTLGAYNEKYNEGMLREPQAIEAEFTDTGVIFQSTDITSIPELLASAATSGKMHNKDRIKLLLQAGPKAVYELAEEIGASDAVVRKTLNLYKNLFEKVENEWHLMA